jgi:hypothetical protein
MQTRPKYAVEKGAASNNSVPFHSIASSTSQHTYTINVPSMNVWVDRSISWTSTCALKFECTIDTALSGAITGGPPVIVFGRDCALASFPLHRLINVASATINDTTVTTNTGDVINEVLRMTDFSERVKAQRTCPTYLDTFQSYNKARGNINNPLAGYANTVSPDKTPNGAFGNVVFTDPAGTQLPYSATAAFYTHGGANWYYRYGVPICTNADGTTTGTPRTGPYPIFIKFTSTEKLLLSPFVFGESDETALFGISNISLIFNMSTPNLEGMNGRVLRSQNVDGRTISALGYNQEGFYNSTMNVIFLTPSLDLPLPQNNYVNFVEFPRYISTKNDTINAGQTLNGVQSQTITINQIPDMFLIYAKKNTYTIHEADYYLPITSLNINFNNRSGIFSSFTNEQLYEQSFKHGLNLDYNQYVGKAKMGSTGAADSEAKLTGGFIIIKPSDMGLDSGLAASVLGNFSFQFTASVLNNTDTNITGANGFSLWVITVNSGFFQSSKLQSRIIKNILTESDVINAPLSNVGTRAQLKRAVGGGITSMLSTAASALPDVVKIASQIAPLMNIYKEVRGKGATGAAYTGSGDMYDKKKSLSARLM